MTPLRRLLHGREKAVPGRGRPLRLAHVVFLSLPILLFGGYFAGGAVGDYVQMRQFDDWWSRSAHTNDLFVHRLQVAFNGPRAALAAQRLDAEAPDAAIVRLDIPKDQWAALQRDKQGTWGVWLDIGLMRGEVPSPVRIRRRGDTSQHWTTEKMSFTLRTPGSERFRGFRTLAFSVADVLPQYVALALAQDFGLLAPYTAVAPLFVNGRYYGLYQVTETIDDDFLTRHGRVRGYVYQGDAAERGDVYPGVPRGLFMNPYIWEFAAGDEDGVVPDRSPLRGFIEDLNDHTFEAHLRLMDRLDRDEIARLVSLLLITGDPYHMDNLHNQFWYADPTSGKLHPIPWDVRLLDLSKPPIWVNEFLRAVLRDPFLVDAVLRETHARLQDGIVKRAEQMAQHTYQRFREHFEYDHLRAGVISDVGRPKDVSAPLRRNAELLQSWTEDARVAFHAGSAGAAIVLDLETRGYAGVDLVGLQSSATAPALRVFADRNRNGRLDAADPVISGSWQGSGGTARFEFGQPEHLLPGWDTRGKGIAAGAVHYRFFVSGAHAAELRPIVRNRITGAAAQLAAWQQGSARTSTLSWSPWQFTQSRGSLIRWDGTVELRENFQLGAADTLQIAPGTTVRLHPEVSLVAHGLVRAEGQNGAPIRFVATSPDRPWGAVALQGRGSDGSSFRHVQFTGGGGSHIDGVRYTGMVNIHHARGVVLEDVTISDNLRSADAFRVAHGEAQLRRCRVLRTNADAVSFDYAQGEVRECQFENIGDDAIKLSGSSARLIANRVVSATGRGVALNEGSKPLVFGNEITGTAVAIDVRGGAEPVLISNSVRNNGIGLQQDQARGQGGWAKLVHNSIVDNISDVESDQTSRLTELQLGNPLGVPARDALLRASGILAVKDGETTSWVTAAPAPQLDLQEFVEDFAAVADGWSAVGGTLRLEKRASALSATLEKRRGGMRRPVDWQISGDSALLMLELSGRDVDQITVSLTSDQGTVTEAVEIDPTEGRYTYVVLAIPAGRYQELRIEALPLHTGWEIDPVTGFQELRRSRLELAGFQVFGQQQVLARR